MNRKLLSQVLLFIAIILSFVYPFPFLENIPYAHATGGAYTSTKHGGGTTDGAAPFGGGVNRGVNPDYAPGGIYNTANPEAGQYQAGECSHCHEPHASFGGVEPCPAAGCTPADTAGPTAYLAMKGDYNSATQGANSNLCWYCHENLTLNAKPPGHGYWDFYWGKTYYQAAGHNTNLNFKWPGTTGDPVATWPRQSRATLASGNSGSCLNCHTPHGIKGALASTFDTTAVPAAKQTVASGNPDVNADYLIPRQAIAWEEALCENCHKSGVVQPYIDAKDIQTDIKKLDTVAAGGTGTGSGHPIHNVDQTGSNAGVTFSGRHTLKNEAAPAQGWNSYSGTVDRHVECVDCHNPHVAQNATVFQQSGAAANPNRVAGPAGIYAGGTNKGVWGITIPNLGTGDTTTSARVDDVNSSIVNYSSLYLYQICLKCHSAFADATAIGGIYGDNTQSPSAANACAGATCATGRWPANVAAGTFFTDTATNLLNFRITDIAVDFSTGKTAPFVGGKAAYHPVFAQGVYQPAAAANPATTNTTNPRWATATTPATICNNTTWGTVANLPCYEGIGRGTGKRATLPTNDFSNNFVPPWGQTSLVACVDCHESDSETAPRGPHGSSRPFILRKLDTGISYTIYCGPNDAACIAGNTKIINYATYTDGQANPLSYDPNNFCLNCHRADVYGFGTNAKQPWIDAPFLSRQPHAAARNGQDISIVAGRTRMFDIAAGSGSGPPPRGILCMRCHGGGSIGGIHGNNGLNAGQGWTGSFTYTTTTFTPATNRLLNGPAWSSVTFGSTTASGACGGGVSVAALNSCGRAGSGNFGSNAMYNY